MSSIAELQAEIAAWADSIHPTRTPISVISKLLEELAELIASEKMSDPLELADIFILSLDLAHLQQVDLSDAIQRKLEINRNRRWRREDNGRLQHIED